MSKKHYNNHYNQKYYSDEEGSFLKRYYLSLANKKEPVLSFLRKKKSSKALLLDIGCGNGQFLKYASQYFECTGIDLSDFGLSQAKKKAPKATVIKRSAYELSDFGDQKFDIITCFDVIEHLIDLEKVITDMNKILKPDGILVISTPNGGCISKSLKWRNWCAFTEESSHIWFLTPSHWEYIFSKYGFVPMKSFYGGLIYPPYVSWLPSILQTILIKYPTQLASFFGLPVPSALGEIFSMVMIKNPGLETTTYQDQLEYLKKALAKKSVTKKY